MQLDDLFDEAELALMLDSGYIRARNHPSLPYVILNYTEKAQWENVWNQTTKNCRGLIYNHETKEIIARPLPKFHNYTEHSQSPRLSPLPSGPVCVSEKLDGSLGIAYRATNGMAIATRGSFTSEQALHATEILQERYDVPDDDYTYLFEIIYPENRVVINYGELDDLRLLGAINKTDGRLVFPDDLPNLPPSVERRIEPSFASVLTYEALPNTEGFVVYWEAENLLVKVKHEEYVRLHKIFTGLTEHRVWEILSNGGDVGDLLQIVPDESSQWIREVVAQLEARFFEIKAGAEADFSSFSHLAHDRKQFALAVVASGTPYRNLIFKLLDGKPTDDTIWHMIEPSGAVTLRDK